MTSSLLVFCTCAATCCVFRNLRKSRASPLAWCFVSSALCEISHNAPGLDERCVVPNCLISLCTSDLCVVHVLSLRLPYRRAHYPFCRAGLAAALPGAGPLPLYPQPSPNAAGATNKTIRGLAGWLAIALCSFLRSLVRHCLSNFS